MSCARNPYEFCSGNKNAYGSLRFSSLCLRHGFDVAFAYAVYARYPCKFQQPQQQQQQKQLTTLMATALAQSCLRLLTKHSVLLPPNLVSGSPSLIQVRKVLISAQVMLGAVAENADGKKTRGGHRHDTITTCPWLSFSKQGQLPSRSPEAILSVASEELGMQEQQMQRIRNMLLTALDTGEL